MWTESGCVFIGGSCDPCRTCCTGGAGLWWTTRTRTRLWTKLEPRTETSCRPRPASSSAVTSLRTSPSPPNKVSPAWSSQAQSSPVQSSTAKPSLVESRPVQSRTVSFSLDIPGSSVVPVGHSHQLFPYLLIVCQFVVVPNVVD